MTGYGKVLTTAQIQDLADVHLQDLHGSHYFPSAKIKLSERKEMRSSAGK